MFRQHHVGHAVRTAPFDMILRDFDAIAWDCRRHILPAPRVGRPPTGGSAPKAAMLKAGFVERAGAESDDPGDGLLTEQIADARGCCRQLVKITQKPTLTTCVSDGLDLVRSSMTVIYEWLARWHSLRGLRSNLHSYPEFPAIGIRS